MFSFNAKVEDFEGVGGNRGDCDLGNCLNFVVAFVTYLFG